MKFSEWRFIVKHWKNMLFIEGVTKTERPGFDHSPCFWNPLQLTEFLDHDLHIWKNQRTMNDDCCGIFKTASRSNLVVVFYQYFFYNKIGITTTKYEEEFSKKWKP